MVLILRREMLLNVNLMLTVGEKKYDLISFSGLVQEGATHWKWKCKEKNSFVCSDCRELFIQFLRCWWNIQVEFLNKRLCYKNMHLHEEVKAGLGNP